MRDKEKASELEVMRVNQCTKDEVSEFGTDIKLFLAGCTYQEQIDREVMRPVIEAAQDCIGMHLKIYGHLDSQSLVAIKLLNEAIQAYHKATGQETEKE